MKEQSKTHTHAHSPIAEMRAESEKNAGRRARQSQIGERGAFAGPALRWLEKRKEEKTSTVLSMRAHDVHLPFRAASYKACHARRKERAREKHTHTYRGIQANIHSCIHERLHKAVLLTLPPLSFRLFFFPCLRSSEVMTRRLSVCGFFCCCRNEAVGSGRVVVAAAPQIEDSHIEKQSVKGSDEKKGGRHAFSYVRLSLLGEGSVLARGDSD